MITLKRWFVIYIFLKNKNKKFKQFDSKSKIVDKLKERVRGDLTEIVKKDVAECNAKILGELKDSLLPSIKYGHGELKDNLKQDTRWC